MAKLGPEYSAIVDLFLEVDSVVDEFKRKLCLPARSLKSSPPKPRKTNQTRLPKTRHIINPTTSEKEWLGAAAYQNSKPNSERQTSFSYSSPSSLRTRNPPQVSRSYSSSYDHNLIASRLASIEQFENEARQRLKSSSSVFPNENSHISFTSAPCLERIDGHPPPVMEPLTDNISPTLLALEGTRLFREETVHQASVQCHCIANQNSYKGQEASDTNERKNAVDELQDAFEELLQEWLSEGLVERCIQQELHE